MIASPSVIEVATFYYIQEYIPALLVKVKPIVLDDSQSARVVLDNLLESFLR
jgi:hypothetical protein